MYSDAVADGRATEFKACSILAFKTRNQKKNGNLLLKAAKFFFLVFLSSIDRLITHSIIGTESYKESQGTNKSNILCDKETVV